MKPAISVYGAGPAGLMAAETLARAGMRVAVHDHMSKPARKLLLAGRGGLNLTHSEPLEELLGRYDSSRAPLEPAIRAFPPAAIRDWCHGLGIETFVGTSGRVFPRTLKASPLLRAWLRRLEEMNVTFHGLSAWPGFDGKRCILAFGGASWPHLGSDARWVGAFEAADIQVKPFVPFNCRQIVNWSPRFASRFAGHPLKNVKLTYGGDVVRGEVMISRDGIEGGAIYALSASLMRQPGHLLTLDLRPDISSQNIESRYEKKRKKDSTSTFLRKAFNLSPVAIGLMQETGAASPKSVMLQLNGPAGLSRSISSAGGVAWSEVAEDFRLVKKPGVFVAGEMLNWSAPTGGYLLQACFSTGVAAARGLLASL